MTVTDPSFPSDSIPFDSIQDHNNEEPQRNAGLYGSAGNIKGTIAGWGYFSLHKYNERTRQKKAHFFETVQNFINFFYQVDDSGRVQISTRLLFCVLIFLLLTLDVAFYNFFIGKGKLLYVKAFVFKICSISVVNQTK